MEKVYISGDSLAFKVYIDEFYVSGKAELQSVEGKRRWVITREDGTKYIALPQNEVQSD